MTAERAAEELYTVDELAAVTGMTVRTTRYYAGLGLMPAPERRGRMAYYSGVHRARLDLIRSLQDHGFTLAAIEKYLARLPLDASAQDLAIQRVMLTGWKAGASERVSAAELERRLGRPLDDGVVETLVGTGSIRLEGERYVVLQAFDVSRQLLDLDLPLESLVEANEAITRHMEGLADELTEVLRTRVLAPYRSSDHSEQDAVRFEETMTRLRELTMQAVVTGFQRAASQVIDRSLGQE